MSERRQVFIGVLNKIRIGDIDSTFAKLLKPRIKNLEDHNYLKQTLHMFIEKEPVAAHNLVMLN